MATQPPFPSCNTVDPTLPPPIGQPTTGRPTTASSLFGPYLRFHSPSLVTSMSTSATPSPTAQQSRRAHISATVELPNEAGRWAAAAAITDLIARRRRGEAEALPTIWWRRSQGPRQCQASRGSPIVGFPSLFPLPLASPPPLAMTSTKTGRVASTMTRSGCRGHPILLLMSVLRWWQHTMDLADGRRFLKRADLLELVALVAAGRGGRGGGTAWGLAIFTLTSSGEYFALRA
uniref:Uncharacterized protein n=1 Tax=Oryza glumipatula TaxID=40148 RepID=A0A0D9ZH28_9ORYZ